MGAVFSSSGHNLAKLFYYIFFGKISIIFRNNCIAEKIVLVKFHFGMDHRFADGTCLITEFKS